MISVLVVDDSSFMRKALSMMLDRASGISVIDTASDGEEAIEIARAQSPDVITMDVRMPRMDGITAVRRIMSDYPCPILMVSSTTKEGADTTVKAMEAGAADFVSKGDPDSPLQIKEVEEKLVRKVRALGESDAHLFKNTGSKGGKPASGRSSVTGGAEAGGAGASASETGGRARSEMRPTGLVVIGISTGGPVALQDLIPSLPEDLSAPLAIAQHMPPRFTASLANRLDSSSRLDVAEAEEGMELRPGMAVLAPGDRHLVLEKRGASVTAKLQTKGEAPHCPSVDRLFRSASEIGDRKVLGIVMTGMGSDGLEGSRQIVGSGGTVIAQSEESSVVYGMPRAVVEAGVASKEFPLSQLPQVIVESTASPAR